MTEGGTLVSKELGKELVNNELEGGMLVRREGGVGRGEGWRRSSWTSMWRSRRRRWWTSTWKSRRRRR